MNRRSVLRQLMLAAGGLALLPLGEFTQARVLAAYDELHITAGQRQLLKKLVDVLLPPTEIGGELLKGAAELEVQDFVLVMASDCLASVDRKKFIGGLQSFDDFPAASGRSRFSELERTDCERVLAEIWGHSHPENTAVQAVQYFLNTTRWYTIQGYLNSEYVMTERMPYQLVPGPVFDGNRKIDPDAKVNING